MTHLDEPALAALEAAAKAATPGEWYRQDDPHETKGGGTVHVPAVYAPGEKPKVPFRVFGAGQTLDLDYAALASPSTILALCADLHAERATISSHEEMLADKRLLTRALDVAMNGEEGAAPQASLCDLIGQAELVRAELRAERERVREALAELDVARETSKMVTSALVAADTRETSLRKALTEIAAQDKGCFPDCCVNSSEIARAALSPGAPR